jgi:hypothetical protein
MDNSDHISRKIKEEFESVKYKAPEHIWSSIKMKIDIQDDSIDEKVKAGFGQIKESAPNSIWEGIEKQLTIDKGWIYLNRYLRIQTFYKWTKRSAALLFVFISIVIGFKYYSKKNEIHSNNHSEIAQNKKQIKTTEKPDKSEKTDVTQEIKRTKFNKKVMPLANCNEKSDTTNQTAKNTKSITKISSKPSEDFSSPNPNSILVNRDNTFFDSSTGSLNSIPNQSSKNHQISLNNYMYNFNFENNLMDKVKTTVSENDSLIDYSYNCDSLFQTISLSDLKIDTSNQQNLFYANFADRKMATKKSKFQLGITSALNLTTVLNNTIRNSFNKESLVTFVPSFGTNTGIQVLYGLGEEHSIVGNLTYLTVNQTYNIFSNGQLNREEINLGFICLQPLYQFSHKRMHTHRTALNIKAGPFLGIATKRKMSINDITNSLTYTNVDFGLTLQIGQSISFNKFIIDYGLNFDSGLNNLNKGMNNLPASFDKTTHLDLGGYISFRYKL